MDMKQIGSKGGKARLTKMSPEERSRIARLAAEKRWKGHVQAAGHVASQFSAVSVGEAFIPTADQREALERIKARFGIGSNSELLDRIIAKWDPALKPSESEPVKQVARQVATAPARSGSSGGFDPLTGAALPERRPMQKGEKKVTQSADAFRPATKGSR